MTAINCHGIVLCFLLISFALTSGNYLDDDVEDFLWKTRTKNDNSDVTCAENEYPPLTSDRPPKYVINLDLPPEERWNQLMTDQTENALRLLKDIKDLTYSFFKGRLFKLIDKYLPRMAETLPEPYLSELKGIAKATNMELGEITLYNIFYEVFTLCTSIITQSPDGRLFHGRNLDFGLLLGWDVQNHTWLTTEALRPLIVELDFQRGGQTVYKSVNFAGYVGVLTGMKPHLFTLTLDERFSLDGGYVGIIRWLLGDHEARWSGFLLRDLLEESNSYHEALKSLATVKLLAPVYFILGGNSTEQGVVITRGRHDSNEWYMGKGSISQTSTWYLVQTNYDNWKRPPFFDDRRTPAIHCLDKMGLEGASLAGLYNVLSTRPVLNKLTTYTTLMDVQEGTFDTWIRYCPDPCTPW